MTSKSKSAMGQDPRLRQRYVTTSLMAAGLLSAFSAPAGATIDNTATVTGTAPGGATVNDTSNTVQVPVAPADPQLLVSKTAVSVNDLVDVGVIAAGDTISYSITVQNTGTVTIYNAAPTDPGPSFNGTPGTGTMSGFSPASVTLAPTQSQVFTVTYTMTNADAFRAAGIANAVTNTASATGFVGSPTGTQIGSGDVTNGSAATTITATPRIDVAKAYTLSKGSGNTAADAEEGDTINYTYTVQNTGNVALANVQISDVHEPLEAHQITVTPPTITGDNLDAEGPVGTSTDGGDDGVWDSMVAGATVSFTYAHVVTQAEFDDQ